MSAHKKDLLLKEYYEYAEKIAIRGQSLPKLFERANMFANVGDAAAINDLDEFLSGVSCTIFRSQIVNLPTKL